MGGEIARSDRASDTAGHDARAPADADGALVKAWFHAHPSPADVTRSAVFALPPAQRDTIVAELHRRYGNSFVQKMLATTEAEHEHEPARVLLAAPEIAMFGNVEVDSIGDPTTITIFNQTRTPITLDAPEIRPGTTNGGHVPIDEFLVAKPSSASVELGRPAAMDVAFAPKRPEGARSTLHVRGRMGTQPVEAAVSLRGQGIKQRRDDDPNRPIHAEQREHSTASWRSRAVAESHSTSAATTYSEMLTAVLAAQRLTKAGSHEDYGHAREVLLAVSRRLHQLLPRAREQLRDFGFGYKAGLSVFEGASSAVDDWIHKLGFDGTIETNHIVIAFEMGAEEIRLIAGERSDAPTLRALHEASKLTPAAIATGAIVGGALGAVAGAFGPSAISSLADEAGLLAFAARAGSQRLMAWGVSNPYLAVELVSSFVGVGTAINSWDDFVQALQDPREAMFLLMQVALEFLHLHQARQPRPTAHADQGDHATSSTPHVSPATQAEIANRVKQLSARVRAIAGDETASAAGHTPGDRPDHHSSAVDHGSSPRTRAPSGTHASDDEPDHHAKADRNEKTKPNARDAAAAEVEAGTRVVDRSRGRGLPEFPIARSSIRADVSEQPDYFAVSFSTAIDGRDVELGHGRVDVANGKPADLPDLNLHADYRRDNQDYAVHIYDGVSADPSGVPKGEGSRTPLTKYALEKFDERYAARFGQKPEGYFGHLIESNRLNFQREFVRLRNSGMKDEVAAVEAVKRISFGRHRADFGYTQFEVEIGARRPVDLGGDLGLQRDVPTQIDVIARKKK